MLKLAQTSLSRVLGSNCQSMSGRRMRRRQALDGTVARSELSTLSLSVRYKARLITSYTMHVLVSVLPLLS